MLMSGFTRQRRVAHAKIEWPATSSVTLDAGGEGAQSSWKGQGYHPLYLAGMIGDLSSAALT